MREHIEAWILEFLSKPNSVFDDLPPCPYAKRAYADDRIVYCEIKLNEFSMSISEQFREKLENYSCHWPKNTDVVIIGTLAENITAEELFTVAEDANNQILNKRGYVTLEDHPDCVEQVGDIVLNQGKYAVLFLQNKQELEKARKDLFRTNYYQNFSDEYKQDIFQR